MMVEDFGAFPEVDMGLMNGNSERSNINKKSKKKSKSKKKKSSSSSASRSQTSYSQTSYSQASSSYQTSKGGSTNMSSVSGDLIRKSHEDMEAWANRRTSPKKKKTKKSKKSRKGSVTETSCSSSAPSQSFDNYFQSEKPSSSSRRGSLSGENSSVISELTMDQSLQPPNNNFHPNKQKKRSSMTAPAFETIAEDEASCWKAMDKNEDFDWTRSQRNNWKDGGDNNGENDILPETKLPQHHSAAQNRRQADFQRKRHSTFHAEHESLSIMKTVKESRRSHSASSAVGRSSSRRSITDDGLAGNRKPPMRSSDDGADFFLNSFSGDQQPAKDDDFFRNSFSGEQMHKSDNFFPKNTNSFSEVQKPKDKRSTMQRENSEISAFTFDDNDSQLFNPSPAAAPSSLLQPVATGGEDDSDGSSVFSENQPDIVETLAGPASNRISSLLEEESVVGFSGNTRGKSDDDCTFVSNSHLWEAPPSAFMTNKEDENEDIEAEDQDKVEELSLSELQPKPDEAWDAFGHNSKSQLSAIAETIASSVGGGTVGSSAYNSMSRSRASMTNSVSKASKGSKTLSNYTNSSQSTRQTTNNPADQRHRRKKKNLTAILKRADEKAHDSESDNDERNEVGGNGDPRAHELLVMYLQSNGTPSGTAEVIASDFVRHHGNVIQDDQTVEEVAERGLAMHYKAEEVKRQALLSEDKSGSSNGSSEEEVHANDNKPFWGPNPALDTESSAANSRRSRSSRKKDSWDRSNEPGAVQMDGASILWDTGEKKQQLDNDTSTSEYHDHLSTSNQDVIVEAKAVDDHDLLVFKDSSGGSQLPLVYAESSPMSLKHLLKERSVRKLLIGGLVVIIIVIIIVVASVAGN